MGYRIAPPQTDPKPTKKANFTALPDIKILMEMFEIDDNLPNGLRWKIRPQSHFKDEIGMNFFNRKYSGNPAGYLDQRYFRVEITYLCNSNWVRKAFHNHRLVWAMASGKDPGEMLVDHIDMDRHNNKKSNLRLVTHSESCMNRNCKFNSESGVKGVIFRKDMGKWRVRIKRNGSMETIGNFYSKEEAVEARVKAEIEVQGEFAAKREKDGTIRVQQKDPRSGIRKMQG